MEKIKSLLTSKKFWTLVAAIVAALTAFFTTSCTGYNFIRKHGIHVDTVYHENFIRNKNFTSCLTEINNSVTGMPSRQSAPCINFVMTSQKIGNGLLFVSSSPTLSSCRMLSIPCERSLSPTFTVRVQSCSAPMSIPLSKSTSPAFGFLCSALMIPAVSVRSRRGGRKGRPRPKSTKTVPLGGSHL
uniref:Uncharacterized protein n=1 Tax=Microviridae sp. cts131 TaxID=2825008 RepID=A0A8S5R2C8_9VIRU|nr:MAG TPA: hypothetical protein [Microviridae sp. cts131]